MRQSLIAVTPEETEALGARLARALPAAHSAALQVRLHGDLGAGKTTLARGFLAALGHAGAVRSPTYTLVETYVFGALTVVHADLYRLQDPDEVEGLGLRDLAAAEHVWLIEWPQRAGPWLPAADLEVTLAAQPAFHSILLESASATGAQWLAQVLS
ncbi:MAG: tRNA (adenosine(37)-N6)-threonylcarbamoyltransferase complex ATPase subunit type 1 TsaE [Steroidobacteraceae bacterium]